jgi:hypothetical protein
MSYSRGRFFHGSHNHQEQDRCSRFATARNSLDVAVLPAQPHTITVSLGDILPILADAVRDRRAWVQDFLSDEVTLSSDLYEVLLAYEHFRESAE